MSLLTTEELLEGFWGHMIGKTTAVFFVLCQIWGNCSMGKSGICKLSTLAIWSGDVINTSMSNCGNMRPHVTANPSSNSSTLPSNE